jgi:hypothetical protein
MPVFDLSLSLSLIEELMPADRCRYLICTDKLNWSDKASIDHAGIWSVSVSDWRIDAGIWSVSVSDWRFDAGFILVRKKLSLLTLDLMVQLIHFNWNEITIWNEIIILQIKLKIKWQLN